MHYPLGHPDEWTEARKQVIILASLMPPPISLDLLTTVTGFSPIKVLKILEELTNKGSYDYMSLQGSGIIVFPFPPYRKQFYRTWKKRPYAILPNSSFSMFQVWTCHRT